MARPTYGPEIQQRSRLLLKTIVLFSLGQLDGSDRSKVKCSWESDKSTLRVETTLRDLSGLTKYEGTKVLTVPQIRESLNRMKDFLKILQDDRINDRGTDLWKFKLVLWGKEVDRNLAEFDKLWESKRSPNSKTKSEPNVLPKSGMKPSAPLQGIPLPDNFVARPEALDTVKRKLLAESEKTLVVSAIAGLGGLGKSVLAAAIVLDIEVQSRFEDGILWVPLGQKPDLLNRLCDLIHELEKSCESFSANTLESASRYLGTLLTARRMLLVVDDVWNKDDAKWFQVGGRGCRVLITTRKEEIEGADCYPLDLMSKQEAIELVQRKLGKKWRSSDETSFLVFAKSLGYLPLALDLAANLVRDDGISWEELREEFESERRDVALRLLDSTTEDWEQFSEEKQRKYSLQACFNLSLIRLNELQRSQFNWLGILPEDVSLTVAVGKVLWALSTVQTKRVLKELRSRSLLMNGPETFEGERTYRVHDLMHDMARGLIEVGKIEGVKDLEGAHRSFLNRYRRLGAWNELPIEEMYIFRYLTWHLEQANLRDDVHDLLAMSDEHGRNAWFEACDRIGQPAIFVKSIADGWRLAEELYERENERAIVLQCRYALITATLNSLVGNLPIGMIVEFVKQNFWTIKQAWSYVEQMQDEEKISESISRLSHYFPRTMLIEVINKARNIQNSASHAKSLVALAIIDKEYENEALTAIDLTSYHIRINLLVKLSKINNICFKRVLEMARYSEDAMTAAGILIQLANLDSTYFNEALDAILKIRFKVSQANNLKKITQISGLSKDNLKRVSIIAKFLVDEYYKADIFVSLAKVDLFYLLEAEESIKRIICPFLKCKILLELTDLNHMYFPEEIEISPSLPRADSAFILCRKSYFEPSYFTSALNYVRHLPTGHEKAELMIILAGSKYSNHQLLISTARTINDRYEQTDFWLYLSKSNSIYFSNLLNSIELIEDEDTQVNFLIKVLNYSDIDLGIFLERIFLITKCDYFLSKLIKRLIVVEKFSLSKIWEIARQNFDAEEQITILIYLAEFDITYLSEAVVIVTNILDEERRSYLISYLKKVEDNFLENIEEVIYKPDITSIPVTYLPIVLLTYPNWKDHLRLLAHQKRADLMGDLATLYPAILHLGGEEAGHGMVETMREVCSQWK